MISASELYLICSLARELRDGEAIAVGNHSPIPAAAALLAKELHAPNASVYILGQPDWPFEGTKEFFDWMQRGGADVFFLSGAQIDRYGNINLQAIGDYRTPKVRLPGGAGAAVVYSVCRRILLFKTEHSVKGFPDELDFRTAASRSGPGVFRRGSLAGVFTPLGTLRPAGTDGALKLSSVAQGVSPETVRANTGFELQAEAEVSETASPTNEERRVLREVVRERLRLIYPEYAASLTGF
ncbi:CoA-transferase [Cohnella faecalis]|uniref:CoA-transferase n=1 Tax=Cohnella faecalis TaxID=2315694 RepID=A0A398CV55_9BACL|nr:CoA-transferase [Cohnella faecalis]RIE05169.1 hypothetical protein D3H35_02025 [Cohnella faecalis]